MRSCPLHRRRLLTTVLQASAMLDAASWFTPVLCIQYALVHLQPSIVGSPSHARLSAAK